MTLQDYANEIAAIKIQIQALEKKMEPMKKLLIYKGPASYITPNGMVQVVETPESIIFNTKALKESKPDIYKEFFNQIRKGSVSLKFIQASNNEE